MPPLERQNGPRPNEPDGNNPIFTLTRRVPPERQALIDSAQAGVMNLTEPMATFLPPLLFSEEVPLDRLWRGDIPSQLAARRAYERQYRRRNLTEAGTRFRDAVVGRTVFDLGSGNPGRSLTPELMHLFGAENYVGIESHTLTKEIPAGASRTEFRKMDMLEFLSRLEIPDDAPRPIFFMSGLSPFVSGSFMNEAIDIAYIRACLEEMQRITTTGDHIIQFRTYGFQPQLYGFQLTYTSRDYERQGIPVPADLTIHTRAASEE